MQGQLILVAKKNYFKIEAQLLSPNLTKQNGLPYQCMTGSHEHVDAGFIGNRQGEEDQEAGCLYTYKSKIWEVLVPQGAIQGSVVFDREETIFIPGNNLIRFRW